MQRITRIGPLSLAKLMGGIAGVFGLFVGAVFTVVSIFGATVAATESSLAEGALGLIFGVGALFVMPLLYGGMAFLQGLIVALLANLAMRIFGGLEVEIG